MRASSQGGNVSFEISLDTEPIMKPYFHNNAIIIENVYGEIRVDYDINGKQADIATKINVYSDIIQKLP